MNPINPWLDPAEVRAALSVETTLVSVMTANNETGVRQPVAEIAAICRERGVLFHTDAIQSFGKEPLPVDADALSLAAHKFGGPKGAGPLYQRGGLRIEPVPFDQFTKPSFYSLNTICQGCDQMITKSD